jgi:hypothetical protein
MTDRQDYGACSTCGEAHTCPPLGTQPPPAELTIVLTVNRHVQNRGGIHRVNYAWRPPVPADGYVRSLELLGPGGLPLLRVPFQIHNNDVTTLHSVCGLGDDPDEIRTVEL